jgi:hypothetical protein
MPDKTTTVSPDKAVIQTGDHDRIVGLSIDKNGKPDQSENFEFIGDKEAVVAATKEQFAQIAVSAIDAEKRAELGLAGQEEGDTSDAKIDALKAEHDKAAKAAESKAEAVVNAAHRG